MAIDPSIALQVRQPEFMGPAQVLALRDMAQRFTMGRMQMEQMNKQQAAQMRLSQLAAEAGAFDENGLPSPALIQKVSSTPGLADVGMDMGKQRMVTLQAMSAIQAQQAQVDMRNADVSDKKYQVFQDLREKSVPAYELAKKAGASDEEAQRQFGEAWRKNAQEMLASGRMNFLPEQEREHYADSVPAYSLAAAGTVSLKELSQMESQQETSYIKELKAKLRAKGLREGSPQWNRELSRGLEKRTAREEAPTSTQIVMGGGGMSEDALTFAAEQYLAGNSQAAAGYGRSPALRAQLQNKIADLARQRGMSPQEVNQKLAEFGGLQAGERTAGTRGANIGFAAAELAEFVPIARDASRAVPRTGFRGVNQLLQLGREQWSPEQAAFVAANRSVINAFAQLASRGVPTVHNTEEAERMLNTAQTPEQYEAVLNQLQKEAEGAMRATQKVQESLRPGAAPSGEKAHEPAPAAPQGFPVVPQDRTQWKVNDLYMTNKGLLQWDGANFVRPQPKSKEEALKYPPGTIFIGPDGKEHIRK